MLNESAKTLKEPFERSQAMRNLQNLHCLLVNEHSRLLKMHELINSDFSRKKSGLNSDSNQQQRSSLNQRENSAVSVHQQRTFLPGFTSSLLNSRNENAE